MSFASVAVAAVALLGGPATAAQAAPAACSPQAGWAAPRLAEPPVAVALINRHRASRGAPALALSPTLGDSASWKVRHMATFDYFGHDDPAPFSRTSAQRAVACGYPASATSGENLAYGSASPQAIVAGWLASPGHRRTIEDPAFRAIGVSAADDTTGTTYWAATFGTAIDAGSTGGDGSAGSGPSGGGSGGSTAPGTEPAPAGAGSGDPARDGGAKGGGTGANPGATGASRLLVRACKRTRRARRTASCRVRVTAGRSPMAIRARMIRGSRTVARASLTTKGARTFPLRFKARRRLAGGRTLLELRVDGSLVRLGVRLR